MDNQVKLSKLAFFREPSRIRDLNNVTAIQDTLMPHQVAVATGCSFDDALTILLLLYDQYLADAFLLVYHNSHAETPIMARPIQQGAPSLPLLCGDCELTIQHDDELSYDYLFMIKAKVNFAWSYE